MVIAVPATVLTPVRLLREQAGAALAPDVLGALPEDPTSITGESPTLSPRHCTQCRTLRITDQRGDCGTAFLPKIQ
jgi:hypothetical protein